VFQDRTEIELLPKLLEVNPGHMRSCPIGRLNVKRGTMNLVSASHKGERRARLTDMKKPAI
jgi:hypothetical protein